MAGIQSQFFWPGVSVMSVKVSLHATSVRKCQKEILFQKLRYSVQIILLTHLKKLHLTSWEKNVTSSDRKHRFSLSMIDTFTRWVKCVPVKFCTSEGVTKSLYSYFFFFFFFLSYQVQVSVCKFIFSVGD